MYSAILISTNNETMHSMVGTMGRLHEITIGKGIKFLSENGEFLRTSPIIAVTTNKRFVHIKTKNTLYSFVIVN